MTTRLDGDAGGVKAGDSGGISSPELSRSSLLLALVSINKSVLLDADGFADDVLLFVVVGSGKAAAAAATVATAEAALKLILVDREDLRTVEELPAVATED